MGIKLNAVVSQVAKSGSAEGKTANIVKGIELDFDKATGSVELDLSQLEHAKKTASGKESYVTGFLPGDPKEYIYVVGGSQYKVRLSCNFFIVKL